MATGIDGGGDKFQEKEIQSDYSKSILLPFDEIFRNLKNARRFAIDIGGSLAKLAYSSTVWKKQPLLSPTTKTNEQCTASFNVSESEIECIRLHFIKFETKYIEGCLDFIRQTIAEGDNSAVAKVIKATGGGAHKYFSLIEEKLKLKVHKEDEMDCLITGCNFLLRNIPDESFTFHHHEPINYKFQTVDACNIFPYLLVNIGSGVSIVKVSNDCTYERIGGTSLGGGSFWGLGSLLTEAKGFDELLKLAEEGDHRNVDMLVSDIYGGDYQKLGLPGDVIASSFGKTVRSRGDSSSSDNKFTNQDVARSLLLTISNCIGQIACLYAQVHHLKRIYFGGFFIRSHPVTMRTISYAINYWSKGEMNASFLRHEGYLGAVGAFLKGTEEDSKHKFGSDDTPSLFSWCENYAGSSGLQAPIPTAFLSKSQSRSALIQLLEMDCAQKNLVSCPYLHTANDYLPDTVDLTRDDEAREYWLNCFEAGIDKTMKKAIESQANSEDAVERANNFKHRYLQHLRLLKQRPFAYGCLNVRSLLDLNEQLLNEYYFTDSYKIQKQLENQYAFKLLANHLKIVDAMEWKERQAAVVTSLLAGNVFDWGSKEIVSLLEGNQLSFDDAQKKLQKRPWLVDDFDSWLERLCEPEVHKCACIFVDNSGADIILGVFMFARELLKRGTKVILCANSRPALNDVTVHELVVLTKEFGEYCSLVRTAYANGDLQLAENGQGSPCLDLSRIDGTLAKTMLTMEVDLIVLEGMGRAVHTNYSTTFTSESLKIAVLKNQWLARRFGGEMFSAVFKYERPENTTFSMNDSSLLYP